MNLHGSPTLEPGRTVYVLLHKNKTHVASLPDGSADWSYEIADMELREKILNKDFKNHNYSVVTAVFALTIIANKQAELGEQWKGTIALIRIAKTREECLAIYKRAAKKIGPHPIQYDGWLKQKLGIN